MTIDRQHTIKALRGAGVVAAEEEADALTGAACTSEQLSSMVARRLQGEPLAWIVGSTSFLGLTLTVKRGVYVPRYHTQPIALHAATHLPDDGTAVDLCTGCGAIAAYLRDRRPSSRLIGVDVDPAATACARVNGVEAYVGDLFDRIPATRRGGVDLVTAVAPYVPESKVHLLARDVVAHEPRHALVGGPSGLELVDRIIERSPDRLRPGGSLVLEVGVDQVPAVTDRVTQAGLSLCCIIQDVEGDYRGVCGTLPANAAAISR